MKAIGPSTAVYRNKHDEFILHFILLVLFFSMEGVTDRNLRCLISIRFFACHQMMCVPLPLKKKIINKFTIHGIVYLIEKLSSFSLCKHT